MKIALLGQLSEPITGEVVANKYVISILEKHGFTIAKVDTNLLTDASTVGRFGFRKAFRAIKIVIKGFAAVAHTTLTYIAPGQSTLGLLRTLPLLVAAKLLSKKVILHWHGYGILHLATENPCLLKAVLYLSSRNILLTYHLLEVLMPTGSSRSKFAVIRNFCSYPPQSDVSENSGRLKVLFLGSLTAEKGYEHFLGAAIACPQMDFIACGSGEDILVERSNVLCQKNGNFKYLGVVREPEKKRVIAGADIFVLLTTYKTEGVPLAILDSMSCGLAVIATPHNGIPETLGESGIWVSEPSSESLSLALYTLDSDRELLYDLKKKSLQRSANFLPELFELNIIKEFAISE